MKIIKNIFATLLVLTLFSCTGSQNKKLFTSGTWHITGFSKNHIDLKDQFSSYIFQFENNDKIIVKNGSHFYSGTWKVTDNGISDDTPKTDIVFEIIFENHIGLSELNAEWRISGEGLSKLSLGEKSYDRYYLVFEKS